MVAVEAAGCWNLHGDIGVRGIIDPSKEGTPSLQRQRSSPRPAGTSKIHVVLANELLV